MLCHKKYLIKLAKKTRSILNSKLGSKNEEKTKNQNFKCSYEILKKIKRKIQHSMF